MTLSVFAQSNYSGSSKITDNWSIELSGGVQTNLNEVNAPQGAVIDLGVNYQVTPIWGVTATVGTGVNNLANWYKGHQCNGTAFDQLYVSGDIRANLTNAIMGYDGKDWEVEAVSGVGYAHNYWAGAHVPGMLTWKTGANLIYNVTDAWAVKVQPAVIWNIDGHCLNSNKAVGQLTAGVVYNFKTSNGTRRMQRAELYDAIEVANLKAEIENLQAENAGLKNVKPTVIEVVKDKVVTVSDQHIVMFAQGSSVLTEEAKSVLDMVTGTVSIAGYASPEGSEARNNELSKERAQVVSDYLTSRGIKVVAANGLGSVGEYSNRVAIITVE